MKRQQEDNLVCNFDIYESTKTESFYEKRVFFFYFIYLLFLPTSTLQSTHLGFGLSHSNARVRSALSRAGRGVGASGCHCWGL